jgi:hypothetical protein
MKKFTIAQTQMLHFQMFNSNISEHDAIRLIYEAEKTLMICKQQITSEHIKELLVFWFDEKIYFTILAAENFVS